MLISMLRNHKTFQALTDEEKEIYLRLANVFEQSSAFLYLSYEELPNKAGIGSKEHWQVFLTLEPVQNYIKGQMAEATRVAQRKAFLALQREAREGNVQAAKEINELSGIMDKQDTSKVVVLHYIKRREHNGI